MVDVAPLPSGKRLHNYGQSPFLMGKSTINIYKWPFSIAMFVDQRVQIFMYNASLHCWLSSSARKVLVQKMGLNPACAKHKNAKQIRHIA